MSSVNKAIIVGRLGKDPELKYTASGAAVCQVSVATSFKTKETETTEWHRIVFWERLAEIVGEYTEKGSLIYVEGRLQTRKYTDKEGVEKYATEIVATSMQLLSPKSGAKQEREPEQRRPASSDNRPRSSSGANAPARKTSDVPFSDMDDDIPF